MRLGRRRQNTESQISGSSRDGNSNVMVMPEKQKERKKEMVKDGEKKSPSISKSQKRKWNKLEEGKEKAALLCKSIRTLEKYKIREDVYLLLRSSGNIGQVETVRQKRLRALQFFKVGLEVPQDSQPIKKKGNDNASYQSELDFVKSHSKQEYSEIDLPRPVMVTSEDHKNALESSNTYQESISTHVMGTNDGCENALLYKAFGNKDNGTCMQEDRNNHSFTSLNCGEKESTKSQYREDVSSNIDFHGITAAAQRLLTVPTVVHVSRPNMVEDKRKDLPIVMMEQEIMEHINEHSTVIICGETGCGKTTQVPQFLYEAGFGSQKSSARRGIIGVTQPRRVAVLSTAKRVAFELGLRLGKEVGFQVRHDKRIGDNCSIKFMTDGILLREVQSDFLLRRYSVIILDEAHERSLNTDILIGMLSRVIQVRQRVYEEQQQKVLSGVKISPENMISELKLVLMSATLRVEDFISGGRLFQEPPPVIEVPTRQYPVTIHFSKKTDIVDYIGQAYKKVMAIHKRLPPGGILVFLTGQREVEYLCQKLRKASKNLSEISIKEKGEKEITADPETELTEQGLNMKDIGEAFEVRGNSSHEQSDRFSAYDGDHDDLDKYESDSLSSSETDSELDVNEDDDDEDGNSWNRETRKLDGNIFNVLGEDGGLASLKAAFEALSNPDSKRKPDLPCAPATEVHLNQSPPGKKAGGMNGLCAGAMCVLPLYAMLPAAAQLRVFEEVREGERLIVVATNVAETSLTIPGIKYVVDTGREKVKNYNSTNGMESYEVQWISKASAAQRAGRAGRTGPGHCYRLYSSAVFSNIFADFSIAEISKIPVNGVVLLMKSMGIDKVENFPFPTPPETTALMEAERCLKALEALDGQGRLTPLGKAMAHYPMSPRHSRMLLTVIQRMKKVQSYARANLVLGYTVAAASALSLPNPFILQFDGNHDNQDELNKNEKLSPLATQKNLNKQEKLRQKKLKLMVKSARAKFANPTSDALTIAYALQLFELAENPGEFCKENAFHLKTMEEMSKLRKQLLQLIFHQSARGDLQQDFSWTHGTLEEVEQAWKVSSDKHLLLLNEEELLGQAICAGWADRVAKRIRAVSGLSDGERKVNAVKYQACMVKETVYLHRRSSVSRAAPEFLVYSELLHTKRPYMHGVTSVKSDWLVKYCSSLCNFSAPLMDPKPYYEPITDEVLCWVIPTFGSHLWQLPLHGMPIKNDVLRVSVFAYTFLEGRVLPCLRPVQKFMAAPPACILRPEASGQRRVGNLLTKLKTRARKIDSRAMLRETWMENPQELRSEILDWFQERFHNQFEELWAQMHREVLLQPQELFPKIVKKKKENIKKKMGI